VKHFVSTHYSAFSEQNGYEFSQQKNSWKQMRCIVCGSDYIKSRIFGLVARQLVLQVTMALILYPNCCG